MAADMLPRVSIVREYRMLRGKAAAYALWQRLDLPEAHAPVMADMPDAHAHDLEHYGIPDFLAECTEVHAPSRVQSAVLYAAYKAWHAGREDVALASSTRFGRLLGAAGLNKVTQGCVYYTGLRLVANHTAMTGAA